MQNFSLVKNENGQMIIEYILLSVLAVAVALLVSTSFKQNELMGQLIAAPWVNLSGMIQNGSWGDPKTTLVNHPNRHENAATMEGDKVK